MGSSSSKRRTNTTKDGADNDGEQRVEKNGQQSEPPTTSSVLHDSNPDSKTSSKEDLFSKFTREEAQSDSTPTGAEGNTAGSAMMDALQSLSAEERSEFEAWTKQNSKLRIMATGKTGVGKSTLLNGLTGINTFKEGHDLTPGTRHVTTCQYKRYGISVVVHDSPGLQDHSGHEDQYLEEMKEKFNEEIDLMLYCISMKVRRAADLKKHCGIIEQLTGKLGADIWKNAVVVLTFANSYAMGLEQAGNEGEEITELFNQRLTEWEKEIHESLKRTGVEETIINNVRVQPAGYYTQRSLPGRSFWLSELWAHVFTAVSEQGKPTYLMLAEDRLKNASEATHLDFNKPSTAANEPIYVKREVEGILLGAAIGAAAADHSEPIGEAMTTGMAVGLLLRHLMVSIFKKLKRKKLDLREPIVEDCTSV